MTSKAQKKADNWTKIEPPIPAEIEHQRSKERRTLQIDARHRGRVEAIWPGTGRVAFDLSTGYGASDCRDWRLTLESARALSGKPDLELREPERTERGRPKVYGKPKGGVDQLSLLDRVQSAPVEPVQPPAPPVDPDEVRRAAVRKELANMYEVDGPAVDAKDYYFRKNRGLPVDGPDVREKAHAYLLREGAACEVRS